MKFKYLIDDIVIDLWFFKKLQACMKKKIKSYSRFVKIRILLKKKKNFGKVVAVTHI